MEEASCSHCREFFSWNAIDHQLEWSPANYFIAIPYTPTPQLLFPYYSLYTATPQPLFPYYSLNTNTTTTIPILFPTHQHDQFQTSTNTTSWQCPVHNSAPQAYIYRLSVVSSGEDAGQNNKEDTVMQRQRQLPKLTLTLTSSNSTNIDIKL